MDLLNIKELNNIPDVPVKDIEIPEWNAKIQVQGLTKAKQVELARISTDDEKDAFDYQKALLKASVINHELDDDAIDKLYQKDAKIIDRIFIEISDINGIVLDAQAEMSDEFQE